MRLGIDLGGTKIECVVLDDKNQIIFRRRVPTPQGNYQETLRSIITLVNQAETTLNEKRLAGNTKCTVGIGIPGTISPDTGLVKNANSTCLIGQDLQTDLEQLLERPVRIANDADCFTLSESQDGAAKQADIVFGVIIGTGVGGGLCIHQKIICGPNKITGEWGHNPLPWPQQHDLPLPPCYCGKSGCIETYLSGPGLSLQYTQACNGQDSSQPTAEEIGNAFRQNPIANKVIIDYIDRLARGLATVINIIDPDVIVLGGGVSNMEYIYTELDSVLPQYVFSDTVNTRIVKAMHGDASGVRGAAWLWDSTNIKV